MNAYIISAIDNNGIKTAMDMECTTWENACILQEALENACDEFAYLIYSNDQWVQECEQGA